MASPDSKQSGAESVLTRRYCLLGLAAVAIAFVLAAALTWRKWPDILVDYGTQLYIPWRILNGAVLYRDLFYFSGGPFSQYFNALLFKIFGVSFSTLIAANLILTAGMVLVVYRYFLAAADVWTATMICLGIVLVFAFGQYILIGNYNYIAPYTYEATHGLILSIFAIALLSDWIKKENVPTVLAAGFCAGLVFLTKPEIFAALAITVIAAFVLFGIKRGLKKLAKPLVAFFCAGIIPSLFFFFYFLRVETPCDSLRSVVFDWLPILQGKIANNSFYKWCTGLDQPVVHLREIIFSFLAVVFVVAFCAFALRWMKKSNWKLIKSQYVVLLLLATPLLAWSLTFDWRQCGWPLPFLSLSACLLIAWNYKKLERPPVFPLLWSVFGLFLLAKLGLFPRISHYGFALAMPAFVSSVYLLFWLLPILLQTKFSVPGNQFRIIVGLVLLIGFGNLFDQSQLIFAKKKLPIGNGGDEILTYNNTPDVGQAINAALLWTKANMPRDATLAVLPDAIIFNYLTRHVNPTPCLFWDPNSIGVYGQSNMTAAFEKNPPDYIFIVERDSSEFGMGYFGSSTNFGLGLMQWMNKNYQTQILIGNEPLKNGLFGIKIMKRLPTAQSQSGGFNFSKSARPSADRKFTPTSNDASVHPKPSRVM